MTRFTRALALVAALGVAGLSSPLAICVTACTGGNTSQPAAHECHEESTPRARIQAETGACSHTPADVGGVALARDPHPTAVTDGVARMTATPPAHRLLTALERADRRLPARPVTSSPILRI